MAFSSGSAYQADSDADDEYERSVMTSSTQLHTDSEASPTDSDLPSENTPTTFANGSNDHTLPRTIITEWTVDECAQFVAGLGLQQYCDAIIEHNVVGVSLIVLRHDELKEMGIASVGHRLTILKSVYDVKVDQDIPIEPDHYIPLSADQNGLNETATKADVQQWAAHIIKLRDERMVKAEEQLKDLTLAYNKLRAELGPSFKMANKRVKPLPEPPSYHPASSNPEANGTDTTGQSNGLLASERTALTRGSSFNTRKPFGGTLSKNHSPTHPPQNTYESRVVPESASLEPSAAATAAANGAVEQMTYRSGPLVDSPSFVPQHSPTSPGPQQSILHSRVYKDGGGTSSVNSTNSAGTGGSGTGAVSRNIPEHLEDYRTPRTAAGTGTPPSAREPLNSIASRSSATPSRIVTDHQLNGGPYSSQTLTAASGGSGSLVETPSVEIFKSFRVANDDPCHKVLPAALKKYRIQADWHQYALYIVYGDQERCIGLDEKPLALLKDLGREGKKPMFMQLRKLGPSSDTPGSSSMPGGVL